MILSPEITLHAATAADHALFTNLIELYLHDLSALFGIKVGADGRFGYDKLPLFWSAPDTHFAYLIRSGGEIAGFALATRGSPASHDPTDLDLAEFFVLRSYRRCGVARRAAYLLWNRHPGRWIVRVSERNDGALRFWERVIREYTRGTSGEKQHPGRSHMFRVFSFTTGCGAIPSD